MTFRIILSFLFIASFTLHADLAKGQLDRLKFDLQKEKPEQFRNRKLRSERTGEKKFTIPAKFVQNTVSHYNYYFNGNEKIKSVIERARMSQKDDYTRLLPYYSYSLDNTAAAKTDLDSVIQAATAGILLHDLRTNWVDNFYMLIGQAYYLEKEFDSAYMAFQFINYNLHPPDKNKSSLTPVVGSNTNRTGGTLSVASNEKRNILQKTLSMPPSRNDALVWQVRTLTDRALYSEAAGLINTLQNDPNFPPRLYSYLDEVQGYWFYKQEMYDSTIRYIESAIPNSIDKQDLARREFLLAQLYSQKNSIDTAGNYYLLAIKHTTDPLLDIYANINRTELIDKNNPDEIRSGIAHLTKMAKRDKYLDYRHIIYLAAGDLSMEIPDSLSSVDFYTQSAETNENDYTLKNKALLKRAVISYGLGNYRDAYEAYSKIQPEDTALHDIESINETRAALSQIISQLNIIDREDSLQNIASLPTANREDYLKKLSKALKKERGIKDNDLASDVNFNPFGKNNNSNTDLFSGNTSKGEWYFYNQSLKSKGFNEFKREWGNRQNIDNWRRITVRSAPVSPGRGGQMTDTGDPMVPAGPAGEISGVLNPPEQEDVSVDGLRANLPLTEELMDLSNQKIAIATYSLAKDYQQLLEDYGSAANTYETSLRKFPDSLYGGELYMNLSYCYRQLGNSVLADKYKNLLGQSFGESDYMQFLTNPEKFNPKYKDTAGTRLYSRIYTKFIEGDFESALAEKKMADSTYGHTYWSPQLLYIESVYHIRNRDDSTAVKVLGDIMTEYPNNPMSEKAENLIRVLNKRDSIENYLTNLKVERLPEDSQIVVFDDTRIYGNLPQRLVRDDSNLLPRKITTVDVPEVNPDKLIPAPVKNKDFIFDPFSPQDIMMVLTKVDPVYSSETRRSLERYTKSKFYNKKIVVIKDTLDKERTLIIFKGFVSAEDALNVLNNLKRDVGGEVSWLPRDKYEFYIISDGNLELLKENKKLNSYLDLLKEKFPDNF